MTTNEHQGTASAPGSDATRSNEESTLIGAGARAFFDESRTDAAEGRATPSRQIIELALPSAELGAPVRPEHSRRYLAYVGASIVAGLTLGYLTGPGGGARIAAKSPAETAAETAVLSAPVTQALPWKGDVASGESETRKIARLLDEVHFLRTEIGDIRHAALNLRAAERLGALEAAREAAYPLSDGLASAARLDRLEARLGQLERIAADRTPTGSVTKVERSIDGRASAKASDLKPFESIQKNARPKMALGGYVLRDVYRGVAFVEGRNGIVEEVAQGDLLPGAGRVTAIARRGNEWIVLTTQGVIDQRP